MDAATLQSYGYMPRCTIVSAQLKKGANRIKIDLEKSARETVCCPLEPVVTAKDYKTVTLVGYTVVEGMLVIELMAKAIQSVQITALPFYKYA